MPIAVPLIRESGEILHLNLNYFLYVLVTKVPVFIKTAYLQAAHNVIKKNKLLCFKEKTKPKKLESWLCHLLCVMSGSYLFLASIS